MDGEPIAAFQQGDISYSILCSSSRRYNDPILLLPALSSPGPPYLGMMPELHMGGPPMMSVMDPPPLGWCQWDLLLERSHPLEAICQWYRGPQWDLLPVPWWCPLLPAKDSGEASFEQLCVTCSLVLLHQETMVLWLCIFLQRDKDDPLPFPINKLILEGRSEVLKSGIFIWVVRCENEIVNSFS